MSNLRPDLPKPLVVGNGYVLEIIGAMRTPGAKLVVKNAGVSVF